MRFRFALPETPAPCANTAHPYKTTEHMIFPVAVAIVAKRRGLSSTFPWEALLVCRRARTATQNHLVERLVHSVVDSGLDSHRCCSSIGRRVKVQHAWSRDAPCGYVRTGSAWQIGSRSAS